MYSSNLHSMTSSWGGPLEFHNIQEIDIELMFELICIFFFCCLFSSLQMIRNEETNNKTGESTKLFLYYYIVVKRM